MDPNVFFTRIVEPTLQFMAASPSINVPVSDAARVLVMTIAGQESRWKDRRQIGGPARSYWQFEKGGGVAGLFRLTNRQLGTVCASLDILCDADTVFEAMVWNDMLACAMARLLLWTDPRPLPAVGAQDAAWHYYLDLWRPSVPHPETWPQRYATAMALVGNVRAA